MKTVLEDDYITTYIGFAEDADLVASLTYMSILWALTMSIQLQMNVLWILKNDS